MAIQIDEIRAAALANTTYDGDLGGLLKDFYATVGYPNDVLRDLEPEWLELMGYDDVILHDQWAEYLNNFGFTGILLTNLQSEADLGNLFPQWIPPPIFSLLMEDDGFLLLEDGFHLLKE